LARLQRKFRLVESPYRTPQALVGGPRLDAALMAASGRTATTKAMGKGSTQHQHLKETEASPKILDGWFRRAGDSRLSTLGAQLRPVTGGSDVLELRIVDEAKATRANIVFVILQDRRGRSVLSVREHNLFDSSLQGTPCMALAHLFLLHRYRAAAVQYLDPTERDSEDSRDLLERGLFSSVSSAASHVIVAEVSEARVADLATGDTLDGFIKKAPLTTTSRSI